MHLTSSGSPVSSRISYAPSWKIGVISSGRFTWLLLRMDQPENTAGVLAVRLAEVNRGRVRVIARYPGEGVAVARQSRGRTRHRSQPGRGYVATRVAKTTPQALTMGQIARSAKASAMWRSEPGLPGPKPDGQIRGHHRGPHTYGHAAATVQSPGCRGRRCPRDVKVLAGMM